MTKYFLGNCLIMKKDDLKSLVTEMYENLLEHIDGQEAVTKEHVLDFLREASEVISVIDAKSLASIDHAKHIFTNTYKRIATEGLSSYKQTNDRFQELSTMHEKTIEKTKIAYQDAKIHLPSITEKFNEIQKHMTEEVNRANDIISSLTKQVAELEKTSNIDPLTQVFNRRALSTYLKDICSKKDIPYELHLLILDLDDFKTINDKYGHVAGDKILIFISNILRKTLRDGDKVFRYGGEEFIIILNRIDEEHCKKIAVRILKLVSSNNLIYNGESLRVTLSLGSTQYLQDDTPDKIIARADKALYQAKKNGKNQMCMDVNNGI